MKTMQLKVDLYIFMCNLATMLQLQRNQTSNWIYPCTAIHFIAQMR